MDQDYFQQFYGMEPYLTITAEQISYIKENFDKEYVKDRLAEIAMTYPLPYAEITIEDAQREFLKLKGIRWNELLTTIKLDEATKPRGGQLPEKIWVVHDANALATHELDLFTRLILQFPGAGIGAVLMFASESA